MTLINKRASDIGDLKDKIINQIDDFSEEKIENLIKALERSEERRRRIDAGEGKSVIEELKQQKVKENQAKQVELIKDLHKREEDNRKRDEAEAEALLKELEEITTTPT